jgi:hypothetical protein
MNQATRHWYIQRAQKHSSHALVRAMRDKYLQELDELKQKPKWEPSDQVRAKELREVLVTLKNVK